MEAKVWNLIDSQTLCWGANWEGSESTVRATVFGKMVNLGRDRIKSYSSDLFHDAMWLKEMLTGPMQFDWIARHSGTFIGEVCSHVKADDYENSVYYRFEIIEQDRKWILNIYEAGPVLPTDIDYSENEAYQIQQEKETIPWIDRHAALDVSECDVAKAVEGCIFHPAPIGGWHMEENNEEEFVLPDEFQPYFSNESLPEGVAEILYGNDEPDNQTLADAEAALKALDPIEELIAELFKAGNAPIKVESIFDDFPTLRNETSKLTRKENGMDSIIRDLREKAQDAENAKEELDGVRYELDSAIEELDEYIGAVNDLIDSLDNLPEVSVSVEVDVNFDS